MRRSAFFSLSREPACSRGRFDNDHERCSMYVNSLSESTSIPIPTKETTMGSKLARLAITFALMGTLGAPVAAENASSAATATPGTSTRTDSNTMAYHGGPIMVGTQDVFFVWYGCWTQTGCGGADAAYNNVATANIITDFMSSLGGSP